ncbi:hypothetical protein [Vibrio harveyi]|uniref:hypothetical protein n=1 Tax=Vibrio harveyi TaxID=669 RepID=UPI0003669E11|nr:hypothetical protein [Vibrio harveyi]
MKLNQSYLSALACIIDCIVIFMIYGALGGALIQGMALFLNIELTEANEFRLVLFCLPLVAWDWHRKSAQRLLRQFGGEA